MATLTLPEPNVKIPSETLISRWYIGIVYKIILIIKHYYTRNTTYDPGHLSANVYLLLGMRRSEESHEKKTPPHILHDIAIKITSMKQ